MLALQALLGRETVCGQSHKATWTARLRFATVLKLLGQRERARNLFSLLASYYPPQLGESHPTSVAVVTSLAELHMLCGQAISAEGILRSLILICDRGGVSSLHAEFLLGECLMMLSRFDEAELLHRRVLGKRRQILGWSHIDTFRSMHALANALVSVIFCSLNGKAIINLYLLRSASVNGKKAKSCWKLLWKVSIPC